MKHSLMFLGLGAALLQACSGGDAGHQKAEDTAATAVIDTAVTRATEQLSRKFFYTIGELPSPLELLDLINRKDIAYNSSLLNPTERADSYKTGFQKSVNYGIYGVDMSYAAFYGQSQDALNYLSTTRQMAKKLGVEQPFEEFVKGVDQYQSEKDSLLSIMDRAYAGIQEYLKSNHRLEVAAHVLTGSVIESQYLSLSLLQDPSAPGQEQLYQRVVDQKKYVQNLIDLMSDMKEYPSSASLLNDLKGLLGAYEGVNAVSDLTKEKLAALQQSVTTVRNNLVK
jgi:hypothetical protein